MRRALSFVTIDFPSWLGRFNTTLQCSYPLAYLELLTATLVTVLSAALGLATIVPLAKSLLHRRSPRLAEAFYDWSIKATLTAYDALYSPVAMMFTLFWACGDIVTNRRGYNTRTHRHPQTHQHPKVPHAPSIALTGLLQALAWAGPRCLLPASGSYGSLR